MARGGEVEQGGCMCVYGGGARRHNRSKCHTAGVWPADASHSLERRDGTGNKGDSVGVGIDKTLSTSMPLSIMLINPIPYRFFLNDQEESRHVRLDNILKILLL